MNAVAEQKVLIVDPSEEFRSALTRALEPDFPVACCGRGDEALELIRMWKPRVIILELSLPGLDGISLLTQLQGRHLVLVVTRLTESFVRAALENLDVRHVLRKPCPARNVAARVRELLEQESWTPEAREAAALLSPLGLPSGRQGYQHLLAALPLLSRDRDQRMSKELYETIAAQSSTSSGGVEKAIRDTIRAGWAEGDREAWQRCFPGMTRCPRNKEFLFRMADLLNRKLCG